MFFKRIITSFFIIFICLMLFIFFIRLANSKSGFLGFKDLLDYLESVDFYKPVQYFNNDVGGIIRSFQAYMTSASQVSSFWDGFLVVLNAFVQLAKLISMPIVAIFDVFKMLWGYIEIFINFINYIVSFEGYPGIVY